MATKFKKLCQSCLLYSTMPSFALIRKISFYYTTRQYFTTSAALSKILTEQGQDSLNVWKQWEYGNPVNESATLKSNITSTLSKVDQLWERTLDDEGVKRGIEVLSDYCSKERLERIYAIANQRTDRVRFVFEDPTNVNNVWAALRSLDSFGIQFIDVILPDGKSAELRRKADSLSRRGSMNAALGSQKWMTLHEYKTTAECIRALREKGFKIFATDLTSKSKLLREFINDSVQSSRSSTSTEFKLAIVMGNEEKGISQEVRELSDGTFYIPMHGFAESLNLSIATAVICEALDSASQSQSLSGSADRGLLAAHMAADLKSRIILTWLTRSVKGSLPLLRRAGLPVAGNSRFNSIGSVSTKP